MGILVQVDGGRRRGAEESGQQLLAISRGPDQRVEHGGIHLQGHVVAGDGVVHPHQSGARQNPLPRERPAHGSGRPAEHHPRQLAEPPNAAQPDVVHRPHALLEGGLDRREDREGQQQTLRVGEIQQRREVGHVGLGDSARLHPGADCGPLPRSEAIPVPPAPLQHREPPPQLVPEQGRIDQPLVEVRLQTDGAVDGAAYPVCFGHERPPETLVVQGPQGPQGGPISPPSPPHEALPARRPAPGKRPHRVLLAP